MRAVKPRLGVHPTTPADSTEALTKGAISRGVRTGTEVRLGPAFGRGCTHQVLRHGVRPAPVSPGRGPRPRLVLQGTGRERLAYRGDDDAPSGGKRAQAGGRQSMSRKGNCWDNAPMESFFHTLKTELVMHCDYKTRDQARASLFDYLEVFYNRPRRPSTMNSQAPLAFEAMQIA